MLAIPQYCGLAKSQVKKIRSRSAQCFPQQESPLGSAPRLSASGRAETKFPSEANRLSEALSRANLKALLPDSSERDRFGATQTIVGDCDSAN
jgi:hypothetical protein